MTVKIGDDYFDSPDTQHVAIRINNTQWRITWLREDHRLTRNQAITAMMIASVTGATEGDITSKDPIYGTINSWAHELGLDGPGALLMVARPRRWEPPAAILAKLAAPTTGDNELRPPLGGSPETAGTRTE